MWSVEAGMEASLEDSSWRRAVVGLGVGVVVGLVDLGDRNA